MDKLSKSSREIYDRAMNFLTSDYAKLLGKNAIITILSLMLIGGASVAGAKGIEKLQLNLDKNIILKSQLSQIADGVLTAKDGKVPSARKKSVELKQMSIGLIDLLSKLGGQYGVKSDPTGADGGSFKGKGWASDFKKKFNEVKKKVYKELTSEEAQLIGATALTTIILGIMGYGTGKAVQYRNSKTNMPVGEDIPKTNTELINDAISSGDNEKLADALAKSIKEGEGATPKTLKQLQDTEFEKTIFDMISKKSNMPATRQDILEAERDLYDQENNPTGIVFPKGDLHDSSDEDEYYNPPTSKTKPPHMKGPGLHFLPSYEKLAKNGGKVSSVTTADIKKYIHKVVTSKEAKGLGIAALTSLIMAGLGIAGYKAHQYTRDQRNPDVTDSNFIKSQRNKAKLKAKEKDIIPIKRSTQFIDMLEEELENEIEDELDRQDMLNIKLSPLYESAQNRIKNQVRAEISSEIKALDDIFKNIESETMTKPIAEKLANNLVDSVIATEVKDIASGKGLKGRGFSNKAKKVKDKIYKIITSPNAKTMGIAALSTLIITALGGVGFHMIKSHDDKLRALDENVLKNSRNRNFIKEIESEWEPEYKEGERVTHFSGMGLNSDTNKRLEIASKKITDLIQYARDIHLDKTALVTLITFLLGSAGYAGFNYIKGKARKSEPLDYIPEDDIRDALEEFATGKHRMSRSENIKADTKDANLPWSGFGLKHFLKGGDLSKFGDYAKKKEEAEKKAKPIAERLTDWIYSDEAKLLGKAGLQYSILTALGLLTAYAGKKAGEKVISVFPKDRTYINDPELLTDPKYFKKEYVPTGDTEAVKKALNQYGKEANLRTGFRPEASDKGELNLKRYLLENPKSEPALKYLRDNLKINKPYDKSILQSDPLLATIFREKMKSKAPLQMVDYYEPDPEFGTFIDASKSYPATKEEFQSTKRYKDVYQGIKNFLNPKSSKVEESKEEFESVMKQVAPTISLGSIESALEALEEIDKNIPDFTVKPTKPSGIVPPKKSVKSISSMFSGTSTPTPESQKVVKSPERQPSGIVQPKKLDKSRTSMFSGTSTPTPESQKVVKSPPVKAPVPKGEKSNPYIDAMIEPISKKKDEGDGDGGSGLKEDFTKTMNKAGDAIYNVITSPQVQGVAGGVTAGLIVSVLSMLMHEKRQETLASRRAIANRPPRPPPVSTRGRVQPPPRDDSEFNPFATQ